MNTSILWSDGAWQISRPLGKGPFSTVYEIHQQRSGQLFRCAMKEIRLPADASEIEKMRREGKSPEAISGIYADLADQIRLRLQHLSGLNGHAHLAEILDYQILLEPDGITRTIRIRTPLLESASTYFEEHIFKEENFLQLAVGITDALKHCHAQYILHGNIKPSNLFINENGDFVLGDFGLLQPPYPSVPGVPQLEDPQYLAPETWEKPASDQASDLYALGITLYMFLNKMRGPFQPLYGSLFESELEKAFQDRKSGKKIPDPNNGSRSVKDAVLKAIAVQPGDRYPNADTFLKALQDHPLSQTPNTETRSSQPAVPPPVSDTPGSSSLARDPSPIRQQKTEQKSREKSIEQKPKPQKTAPKPKAIKNDKKRLRPSAPARAKRPLPAHRKARLSTVLRAVCMGILPAVCIFVLIPVALFTIADSISALDVTVQISDSVYFGKYEQDNNPENGMEDIVWIVLDRTDDKVLLLSKSILDVKPFYKERAYVEWADCTLRSWLNGDFFDTAFASEQDAILTTHLVNQDPQSTEVRDVQETDDKVFCLSIEEARHYQKIYRNKRHPVTPTVYAKAQCPYWDTVTSGWRWWLRQSYSYDASAAVFIDDSSWKTSGLYVNLPNVGVRPALWVDLNALPPADPS